MTVVNLGDARKAMGKLVEDVFTKEEIDQARELCEESPIPAIQIETKITKGAIDRINKATGQANDAKYWSYMLEGYCKGIFDK
jgi:hypothetical protein